jgi:hypothetical protein
LQIFICNHIAFLLFLQFVVTKDLCTVYFLKIKPTHMKKTIFALAAVLLFFAACQPKNSPNGTSGSADSVSAATSTKIDSSQYKFEGGYPTAATIQKAYDDADLTRAIEAYKFFYASVSGYAIVKGSIDAGLVPNKVFGTQDSKPKHVGYTLNSDTPYGPLMVDLSVGPIVIELPPGPLIVAALDVNQRWVADMGIPGPDGGKGGKHLILPPGYKGDIPKTGYYVWHSSTNNIAVGARSLPVGGDVPAALNRITTVKVYPLHPVPGWETPKFIDMTPKGNDTTPLAWEMNIKFWEVLHDVVDKEPAYEGYRTFYGELAILGIIKGQPFNPDARMKHILEQAAVTANGQMRVQAFADRRPDRLVWKDRKWEWVALRSENATFDLPTYTDLDAREVWFYQAIGTSPAMFRRQAGSGSLYFLGLRDKDGNYVDGGKTYKLTIPQPVPAKLFWSATVYDAETRSEVQTDQGYAALRSMFELKSLVGTSSPVDLYFGPKAPAGKEGQWIKTIPGKGWFVYIRIYGPEQAAFDGSWKPGDFEEVK